MKVPYTPPIDWQAVLAFLRARAIAGVEGVGDRKYQRTVRSGVHSGTVEVAHDEAGAALMVTVHGLPNDDAEQAIERVRWMFDLDAALPAIRAHLLGDPAMAALVAARPGLRVFRGWDGFEVAARSVIGQQVTVARARQLNGVLVDLCGQPMADDSCAQRHRLFPTPQQVLDGDLSAMGMPGSRVTTLKTIASAALLDPHLFDSAGSIEATVAKLRAIRGIGDWTAHYIAMRACGEPDAFPASDIGLLRGAAGATGERPTPAQLLARAEAWRPWRAYAAHQLWAADA